MEAFTESFSRGTSDFGGDERPISLAPPDTASGGAEGRAGGVSADPGRPPEPSEPPPHSPFSPPKF